jgi:hypothetical protein
MGLVERVGDDVQERQRPQPEAALQSMKPIWLIVDQASAVFTALWVSITVAPKQGPCSRPA